VADDAGYPTILIVYENDEFRGFLVRNLQPKGYLILEAQNATEAYKIVIRHSRRIHLLLADDSDDSRVMAATLKPYRSDMQVIHIGSNLTLNSVLTEVYKQLDLGHVSKDKESTSVQGRLSLAAEVDKPNEEKKRNK
jgi:CheY-like chemotaxis protein